MSISRRIRLKWCYILSYVSNSGKCSTLYVLFSFVYLSPNLRNHDYHFKAKLTSKTNSAALKTCRVYCYFHFYVHIPSLKATIFILGWNQPQKRGEQFPKPTNWYPYCTCGLHFSCSSPFPFQGTTVFSRVETVVRNEFSDLKNVQNGTCHPDIRNEFTDRQNLQNDICHGNL